jgi:hypothetical protein
VVVSESRPESRNCFLKELADRGSDGQRRGLDNPHESIVGPPVMIPGPDPFLANLYLNPSFEKTNPFREGNELKKA